MLFLSRAAGARELRAGGRVGCRGSLSGSARREEPVGGAEPGSRAARAGRASSAPDIGAPMGAGRRLSDAEPGHDGGGAPLRPGRRRANRPVEPPSRITTGPGAGAAAASVTVERSTRWCWRAPGAGRGPTGDGRAPAPGHRRPARCRRRGGAPAEADRRAPADRPTCEGTRPSEQTASERSRSGHGGPRPG